MYGTVSSCGSTSMIYTVKVLNYGKNNKLLTMLTICSHNGVFWFVWVCFFVLTRLKYKKRKCEISEGQMTKDS